MFSGADRYESSHFAYNVEEGSAFEDTAPSFGTLAPVKSTQPSMETWVVCPNHLEVALERRIVCHVEADQRGIQADVGLCDVFPEEEGLMVGLPKVLLQSVKGLEELEYMLVVCRLRSGKAYFVDTVVDAIINPCIELINLVAKMVRNESGRALACFALFKRQ